MKICQKCEAEVKEDEDTCPRCGSKDLKEEKFCRILGTKLNWKRKKIISIFHQEVFQFTKQSVKPTKSDLLNSWKLSPLNHLKKFRY